MKIIIATSLTLTTNHRVYIFFTEWQVDVDSFADILKEDDLGEEYRQLLKLPMTDYLKFKINFRELKEQNVKKQSPGKVCHVI